MLAELSHWQLWCHCDLRLWHAAEKSGDCLEVWMLLNAQKSQECFHPSPVHVQQERDLPAGVAEAVTVLAALPMLLGLDA